MLCCWTRPVGIVSPPPLRVDAPAWLVACHMSLAPSEFIIPRAPAQHSTCAPLVSSSKFLGVIIQVTHSSWSNTICPAEAAVPSSCRLSSCLRHFHCTALRITGCITSGNTDYVEAERSTVYGLVLKSHLLGDCAFSSLSRNSIGFRCIDLVGRCLHPPLHTYSSNSPAPPLASQVRTPQPGVPVPGTRIAEATCVATCHD